MGISQPHCETHRRYHEALKKFYFVTYQRVSGSDLKNSSSSASPSSSKSLPLQSIPSLINEVVWNKVFGNRVNFQCFMYPVLILFILIFANTVSAVPRPHREHEHHHSNNGEHEGGGGVTASSSAAALSTSRASSSSSTQIKKRSGNNDDQNQALILRPEHFSVPCGGVIQLFPRYGYFSLSMRVISKSEKTLINSSSSTPPNEGSAIGKNDSWVFLEPVNNVIDPTTLKVEETTFSSTNENESLPFHNLFHFDLCEDVRELLNAYFKNFTIEGLDKPWQAFSGGWRVPSIARYFGIDQVYVEGDYRFILAKIFLVRGTGTAVPLPNITASTQYKPYFQRFKPNNDLSTYEFLKIVGSHYIHSYTLGNSVYQVLVFDPDGWKSVLQALFYDGVKQKTTTEYLQKLPETLTRYIKYYGRVYPLNSLPNTMELIRQELMTRPYGSFSAPVPSIFKLHNNSELAIKLMNLLSDEPSGILGIDLRSIDFLFSDPVKRAGFEKALKHKMQLWEINFQY